ncbi:Uncharacterized protein OBRU01_26997 [Operophtera brumata]|uniref:FP protein C-terminal domain-containing protein n=1 Tax=Operophtera brumata TaxID=104452 RepID=A0A0L7K2I9_OPEBR|nr:Uncharacterized protein OBRU01_26997 [Operophtera brumata]
MGKSSCVACGKFLSPIGGATCSFCAATFHKACVLIQGSVSSGWVCSGCKANQKRGDNSDTPVKTVSESSSSTSTQVTPQAPAPVLNTETQEMRRELAEYMEELRAYRKEMADFRSVVAAINERLDGLDQRLETIEQRKPLSAAIEVVELEKTVAQLKNELNERDQEALSSDLDIGHLPEIKGENILHTVIQVAAKLGVTLEARDIVFVERVGSADRVGEEKRARRVVVRLARRQLRDDLLSAARVRRTLSTTQLDIVAPTQRIYLNERLTRANRQLFHQVREECRRLQWRYSWTKRGRIYARQGDGKQVYPIRSEADVKRVFGPNLV